MAPARGALSVSAQQLDPLSWFTGPLLPVAFSVMAFIYGAGTIAFSWDDGGHPWLQPIALVLSVSSGLIIHLLTRPLRQRMGWGAASLAMVPAVLGMIVSAVGYAGSTFSIVLWWAPGGLALALAGLGPYLPVRTVALVGSAATAVGSVASVIIVHPTVDAWGPIATAVIMSYAPVLATAATVVFSYSVVTRTMRMLNSSSRIMVAGQEVRDEAARRVEQVTLARLTGRVVPFLEGIADAARITPADRALAGQLARRMRDELVTQSGLSWLDSIARESRLVVVDPEQRAQRMNNAQRTALRGMLRAILDMPGTDSGSLMVELRAAPDGATAVGVSLDMALPEGRRIMHLAPHYLTLKTAVDDLTIDTRDLLRLSFRIPAG